MFEDGDDILRWVGVGLAAFIVAGVLIGVLAAWTAPQRAEEVPTSDFRFERVNDTHVQVIHQSGDAIPQGNVVVTVDGLVRQDEWTDVGENPDDVSPGDSLVLRVEEGSLVRVFWDAGEGDRKRLARYRVQALNSTSTA